MKIMGNFKTKPKVTINKLTILTDEVDIIWDYKSDNNGEYLFSKFKITEKKTIDIKLTNHKYGWNYWIEFFYNNKLLATYYYQNYNEIFELFVYAKFVNYIKNLGEDDFIDTLISTADVFEWDNIQDLFYSTLLDKSRNEEARLNVWKGGVEIEFDGDIIHKITDDKLFKYLNNNI